MGFPSGARRSRRTATKRAAALGRETGRVVEVTSYTHESVNVFRQAKHGTRANLSTSHTVCHPSCGASFGRGVGRSFALHVAVARSAVGGSSILSFYI